MNLFTHMKKLLTIAGILFASVAYMMSPEIPMEMTEKATPDINWNVEIKNRYNEDIIVEVRYADGKNEQVFRVPRLIKHGESFRLAQVNTYRKIRLNIWTQGQFGDDPERARTKKPKYMYNIDAQGNTIFVTFDDQGNLYPQRGEFLGITGKTQSGLSKTSNVKKNNINLLNNSISR